MSVQPKDKVCLIWRDLGADGRVLVKVMAGMLWGEAYVKKYGDVTNFLYCEEWEVA